MLGDAPFGDADESFPEEIQVLDPRHPLYGRSFQVLGRSRFRRGSFSPYYEVVYRDRVTLNIPVTTTDPLALPSDPTKLSVEALMDLLNVVESECHEYSARRSLDDAAGGAKAPDCQRHRRGSGRGIS